MDQREGTTKGTQNKKRKKKKKKGPDASRKVPIRIERATELSSQISESEAKASDV